MKAIAHRIALPVLSAAIMGGAALGLAGVASAASGLDGSSVTYSYMASPTVYAQPATNWVPWASEVEQGNNADNADDIYGDLVGTVAHP